MSRDAELTARARQIAGISSPDAEQVLKKWRDAGYTLPHGEIEAALVRDLETFAAKRVETCFKVETAWALITFRPAFGEIQMHHHGVANPKELVHVLRSVADGIEKSGEAPVVPPPSVL